MPTPPSSSAALKLTELLVRCRQHEPAAQRALYERFFGPMLLVSQRYAPTLADAEDALQDAFIKVFQKLADQRDPAAFAGWVRRIVISTALDAWQKRRLRRTDFALDEVYYVAAPEASAIEQLAVAEVRALIDRLPDGCRLVLLLYTVEGYAHAEIAELLGISEGASKAQLTRARQRLTGLVEAANRERAPAPPPSVLPLGQYPAAPPAPRVPFHPLTTLLLQ